MKKLQGETLNPKNSNPKQLNDNKLVKEKSYLHHQSFHAIQRGGERWFERERERESPKLRDINAKRKRERKRE